MNPNGRYTSTNVVRSASELANDASSTSSSKFSRGCFAFSSRRREMTAAPSGPRSRLDTASLASLIHPSTSSSVAFSSKYARYRPLTRGRDVISNPLALRDALGVPRPLFDRGAKLVEIVRRERRVRVVEAVPPLALEVREPPSERLLDLVRLPDPAGERHQIRGRGAAVRARCFQNRIHRAVPLAPFDVLRWPLFELGPVRGRQRVPDERLFLLARRRLRARAPRARRRRLHRLLRGEVRETSRGVLRLRAHPGDARAQHRPRRRLCRGGAGAVPLGELRDEIVPRGLGHDVGILLVLLRVRNVVRRRGRELVLFLPAPVRVRLLWQSGPLLEAILEPRVRDDALYAGLVRLRPLRAFKLVAHQVRRFPIQNAHVLRAETLRDLDELRPSVARVPGDAHLEILHRREPVHARRRAIQRAVVHGHERALFQARLDPVPRDDALLVLRRARVQLLGFAERGLLQDDVRDASGVVRRRRDAAVARDVLRDLDDLRPRAVVPDEVVDDHPGHESVDLVDLQRRGGRGHRDAHADRASNRCTLFFSTRLLSASTPLTGSTRARAVATARILEVDAIRATRGRFDASLVRDVALERDQE
eukprot:31499-Pelagococcus_subviridis.AAC.53